MAAPSQHRRRATFPAVVVVLVVVVLVGACGKATPGATPAVTLRAGATAVHTEASAYQRGTGAPKTFDRKTVALTVTPGQLVEIDVDPPVAAAGWIVTVDGTQVISLQKGRRAGYTVPDLGTAGVRQLIVYQAPRAGQQAASGRWTFVLVRAS